MSTQTEVRRFLEPIARQHPDLAQVGRMLIVTPVRHVLCFVLLDRTGEREDSLVWWGAWHLFQRFDDYGLNYCDNLRHHETGRRWQIARPGAEAEFAAALEDVALPRLRAMTTIENFFEFAAAGVWLHPPLTHHPTTHAIVMAALGRFHEARTICETLAAEAPPYPAPESPRGLVLLDLLPLLEADDPAAIAQLLHAWEAHTVTNLKLTHLWQPSPFPFEESES